MSDRFHSPTEEALGAEPMPDPSREHPPTPGVGEQWPSFMGRVLAARYAIHGPYTLAGQWGLPELVPDADAVQRCREQALYAATQLGPDPTPFPEEDAANADRVCAIAARFEKFIWTGR